MSAYSKFRGLSLAFYFRQETQGPGLPVWPYSRISFFAPIHRKEPKEKISYFSVILWVSLSNGLLGVSSTCIISAPFYYNIK